MAERNSAAGSLSWARFKNRGARQQWTGAVHELAMMLHGGIPLLEALDTIIEQHSGPLNVALVEVRDRVAAGAGLAEALSERPDLFDPTDVHLVEVGENAGTLDVVLEQLAEFRLRTSQFKDRVLTSLMYPSFLVVFGLGAAVFLMTVVLPPLLENIAESTDDLPWPTKAVLGFSNFLVGNLWWLAIALFIALLAFVFFIRSANGRIMWHRFLLRLPIIGPMLIKQNLSRIAMIVGTLSRSGVELTRAIELAGKSTPNAVLAQALEKSGEHIEAGAEIAEALDRTNVFPPLAVRVFSVGQDSGRLEEMLTRLATDYDRQVESTAARITSLLEPILIVVLAIGVGFLLLATILPILEAGNVM
ncbi:MAG: type II secretion system F family protein [Planctomycetaceae bacterium]